MIIDGCKRTGLLATLLVGGMMCVPSAANADAIVTLSGPTSNAAHGVPLPTRPVRHLIDCCPFGSAQHRNHRVLLRRALRVGLRLRQDFNCRPQLIDQRVTVADFLALLDIGQSVPERSSRLPLSRAACNSSLDATTISPSLTAAGGSRHRVIPSLPMM
jgi:hypothetical protein